MGAGPSRGAGRRRHAARGVGGARGAGLLFPAWPRAAFPPADAVGFCGPPGAPVRQRRSVSKFNGPLPASFLGVMPSAPSLTADRVGPRALSAPGAAVAALGKGSRRF